MKQVTIRLALFIVAVAVAGWAQTGIKQPAPSQASQEEMLRGCLSQQGQHYVLTDPKGVASILSGDTSELQKSVGHEIEVKGKSMPTPTGSEPTKQQTHNGKPAPKGNAFQVESARDVSDHCSAGNNVK